jgi:hypothetical protein
LRATFQGFTSFENDGAIFVLGTYRLIEHGSVIDNFTIRISLPPTYPFGLPIACEGRRTFALAATISM